MKFQRKYNLSADGRCKLVDWKEIIMIYLGAMCMIILIEPCPTSLPHVSQILTQRTPEVLSQPLLVTRLCQKFDAR